MLKILFPTDFSALAQGTLDQLFAAFSGKNFELTLFHSVIPPKSVGGGLVNIEGKMLEIGIEEMEQELARINNNTNIKSICRLGFLEDTLSIAMRESGSDLIIMCSKGESNLESKLFGSNAETCLRNTNYPVLIAPPQFNFKIEKMTYTTSDGYLAGKTFLTKWLTFLGQANILLEKLTVIKTKAEESRFDVLETFMEKQIPLFLQEGKDPYSGIALWLENNDTDLVIINSEHKKWYQFLLNTSVTKQLASKINQPLLSLPNLK